jgi:hypothetical protein
MLPIRACPVAAAAADDRFLYRQRLMIVVQPLTIVVPIRPAASGSPQI